MLISEEPAYEIYRVIVLGRDGAKILAKHSDQGLHFPQVSIPRWQRVAEEVTAAMKKQWGEEIVCLFDLDLPPDGQGGHRYIATRYWRNCGGSAAPLKWISVNDLDENWLAESADYRALRNSLDQSSSAVRDAAPGLFARLSWFDELCEWIGWAIAPRALYLTGSFRQLNASPCFSLIRFETNGPALWFKAVGEPNEREFPITLTLARVFSDYTPEIVATRPEWNGWLMCEAEGTDLDETADPRCWEKAGMALANLQIESIRSLPEILDCGAHNLTLHRLRALVSPFMDVAAALMKKQSKTPPPILGEVELGILNERIQEALSVLEGLGIPDSLGHLDLNPANLIVSGERCVFLDWAEAYVGHPFFTFQYLLEHLRRTGADSVSEQRLISSYFAPWEQIASPNRVVEAAALAPLLAAFAYAAGAGIWAQPERRKEPKTAGYLRSLVRRMNREAHKLNERRSLCPMPKLMEPPPRTPAEPVTEILHGVPVTDPYRWLEDQESERTRAWIAAQTQFTRSYLDAIPSRDRIRTRIRELLDVETYDSILKVGTRYFFRKRLPGQEQPCIYVREGIDGPDQLLIDPAKRGTGKYTAVKPLRASPDGRLLLYEVKEGGERSGSFELLDIENEKVLSDILPRGYLRGFAFAPDSRSFYYVYEPVAAKASGRRAACYHRLGARFNEDTEVFAAGEGANIRLHIVPGRQQLGFLVFRFLDRTFTDFYVWTLGREGSPEPVLRNADYKFGPILLEDGRILAITDHGPPNLRIVEVHPRSDMEPDFTDVIASSDVPIQNWIVTEHRIFVSYLDEFKARVEVFDLRGSWLGELPLESSDTVRLAGAAENGEEVFFERESFTKPIQIYSCSADFRQPTLWAKRKVPFNSGDFAHTQVWYAAKDGMRIPMFLVGRRDLLDGRSHPVVMTAYGGYGVPMTPQFSVLVAFLMERGCLFALPNIRGGSEFGTAWHEAAKGRKRQVAADDFLSAAEWLVATGRTEPQKLAIFGGSNSGLLVGAAMTQRPELFRAVLCMVPMLDMIRYHLFDGAQVWKEEFGTADDPEDFPALFRYSPYHRVTDEIGYPATMIVSGDSDQNCNPLHARKMTARLQAANASGRPILLDYSHYRGHSPVLPLSNRIDALTDRLAFLCDQLQLSV